MLARIERYRAEHGPYLREIRCGYKVLDHLRETLPKAEPGPRPLPMPSVPLIDDSNVPPGYARQVYDDGSTKDVQVLRFEFTPEAVADALKIDWPTPDQIRAAASASIDGTLNSMLGHRRHVSEESDDA